MAVLVLNCDRGGRWRSWPYLAERAPAEDAVFWGALCDEWNPTPTSNPDLNRAASGTLPVTLTLTLTLTLTRRVV